MLIVFAVVFFLATCSIIYVLFPSTCFTKGVKILKHLYTIRTLKKKEYKSIS